MARRILSAESALLPQSQPPLSNGGHANGTVQGGGRSGVYGSVKESSRSGLFAWLQERWGHVLSLRADEVLFDWADRGALMREIQFVNETRGRMDEAAVKLSPSMLRIVLTVQAHVPGKAEQRAFLAQHLEWDLRRVSELCLVADRYGLLDADRREEGRRELTTYGWSCALKLAALARAEDRREVWERASGGTAAAPYRTVLEELKRFRERKLIGPPATLTDVNQRLASTQRTFEALGPALHTLTRPEHYQAALARVNEAQRELRRLRRALVERLDAHEVESYAESA